jgi:hypothetical protein
MMRLGGLGQCGERRAFGPGSVSRELQLAGPERLLALSNDALRLYDTSTATGPALLATAALAESYLGTKAKQPIQVTALATPSAAEDRLVGLPYYGDEPYGYFQLFTLSDNTLTARGVIEEHGFPQDVTRVGRSLVTVSSTQLRTFDAAALDDLSAPGALQLDALYYIKDFTFDEVVARIRFTPFSPQINGPQPTSASVARNDLQITETDTLTPLASLPVEATGGWEKVDELLVNFQFQLLSWNEQSAIADLQVYDLGDPLKPRRARWSSTTSRKSSIS